MYIQEDSGSPSTSETFLNKLINNLPMGCLSSRSTVAPTSNPTGNKTNPGTGNGAAQTRDGPARPTVIAVDVGTKVTSLEAEDMNFDGGGGGGSSGQRKSVEPNALSRTRFVDEIVVDMEAAGMRESGPLSSGDRKESAGNNTKNMRLALFGDSNRQLERENDADGDNDEPPNKDPSDQNSSFDDEAKMELYRQYIAIDYEITQLEDRDTLRVYHEKIEQLEQLERELDMITGEAEEAAARSDSVAELQPGRLEAPPPGANGTGSGESGPGQNGAEPVNGESNSILSGITSVSRQSWKQNNKSLANTNLNNNQISLTNNKSVVLAGSNRTNGSLRRSNEPGSERTRLRQSSNNPLAYSTVEEVFNRKIILEKERDRLKKEVELIIIECDKLQQRYKRRDEILDSLFDGHAGNGLENHLEQQLNWLIEQKHYVDQVFYAWKRAETLTSQTCEQFASALELLKRLTKIQDDQQRDELAKTIGQLLVKSRQDMEQAQKYNPNVDAPFFTDNETERFDKIIETISSNPISPSEYSQILTVIQFAYKRSVSIRLWLEQILQTTIARDSFELAEEYKWIAIQLRKERINIIKSKLQEPLFASMAKAVLEQMMRQQIVDRRQRREINRDSGVESEVNEWDIEEEIYRLLEMNKARLQNSGSPAMLGSGPAERGSLANGNKTGVRNRQLENSQRSSLDRDQIMKNRIENRMRQSHGRAVERVRQRATSGAIGEDNSIVSSNNNTTASMTPSKLRVQLDEDARRRLLEQVGELHNKHKNRIELLRTSSKAKANSFIINRKMAREQIRTLPIGIAETEGSS